MKLSLNWLNDFIDLSGISAQEIAEKLTLSTCEVEDWKEVYSHLNRVVLAQVATVEQHPNADRLKLCRVKYRRKNFSVVCGATNVRPGMLAAFAPVGTLLPGGGEPLKIRQAVIRGVTSEGMLCSAAELELEQVFPGDGLDNSIVDMGSFAWDENIPDHITAHNATAHNAATRNVAAHNATTRSSSLLLGSPLGDILPLVDTIFEVDNKSLTHRPDLWSHFGFARELAAIFERQLRFNPLEQSYPTDRKLPRRNIHIQKGAALAYFGLHASGIEVGRSPFWMQARLINVGQRPINNVVDASNYLMFESGQPNHAFDTRSLRGKSLSVALTSKPASIPNFISLDGAKYSLQPGTVVISDGPLSKKRIVALGGVIGGIDSGVKADTTQLFIESATFPRQHIRRAIVNLGLRTEAARRFEKGQDPAMAKPALFRLAQLLKMSCPALKVGVPTGAMPQRAARNRIRVGLDFLQKRLGFAISAAEVENVLTRLQFRIQSDLPLPNVRRGEYKRREYNLTFRITAPSFRSQYDITRAEDIVEELGRLYLYDNIQPTAPPAVLHTIPADEEGKLVRFICEYLVQAGGFNEVYNYSFISQEDNQLFKEGEPIELQNPLSAYKKELRLSQLPGLLRQIALNQDRYDEVRLFECGRTCRRRSLSNKGSAGSLGVLPTTLDYAGPADEKTELSLAYMSAHLSAHSSAHSPTHLSAHWPAQLSGQAADHLLADFLGLRLLLERLFASLSINFRAMDSEAAALPSYLHPRAALAFFGSEGCLLGHLGLLHPLLEQQFELKRGVILANFAFPSLYAACQKGRASLQYKPPSIYPASYFEVSVILPLNESSLRPAEVIHSLNHKYIRQVLYLTHYCGVPLPVDQKSVSYRISCASAEKTLSSQELQETLDTVCAELARRGYPLRQ